VAASNKIGPGKYHVILGLKSFDLPDSDYHFKGKWLSIQPCPNRPIPVVSSAAEDAEWRLPLNINDRYPTCEFYMDIPFTTTKPLDHGEIYECGMDRALWITSLIRLYQAGDLFAYVYDITGPGISRGLRVGPSIFPSLHANPPAPRYSPYYLNTKDEVDGMAAFVNNNVSTDWSAIRLPLDRLGTYYKRSWGADLVIDLMIILESLFTHGHENISYQVRLKTAAFLKGTEEISRLQRTPEDIFEFIRKAYDTRSDIVHGGSKALKWMSGEFKSHGLTRHNVAELEEIVRSCLRVTLHWIRQGRSVSPSRLDKQLFLA
jgi:hypothetical protein